MRVIFISSDFQRILEIKTDISIAYLETVIENFKKDIRLDNDSFIKFYGNWGVYVEEHYREDGGYQEDFNLYYKGTIVELLPAIY